MSLIKILFASNFIFATKNYTLSCLLNTQFLFNTRLLFTKKIKELSLPHTPPSTQTLVVGGGSAGSRACG
jgi:hypothetical protein